LKLSTALWDELYDYQQKAVEFVVARDGSALFFEQGTGKTWITAAVIERLMSRTFQALLVVPLANLETTWYRTLTKKVLGLNVAISWEEFKQMPMPRVMLLNYEALPDVKRDGVVVTRGLIHRVRKHPWDLVAYDESQRLKDRGSVQSRRAKQLRHHKRRLILSGTPVEQAPQDVWAQLRFAASDVLGDRWADFEDEFLRRAGYMGYKREFKKHKLPQFLERIAPVCWRVEKKDVLELPPLKTKRHVVKLRGEQRELYEALERDMVANVGSSKVSTELEITKMVKLQQVCGGWVKDDEGEIQRVGQAKQRAVGRIVKRINGAVVIFCRFREEVAMLLERLPGSRALTGKTPKRHRAGLVDAFQSGEFDVLICQVRTGGVGLDLFRAHHAIIYSSTFSFIDYDQAIARLHRIGQKHEVTIHLIFARATIDEDIITALSSKQSVSDLVLRRLKPTEGRPSMAKGKKTTKKTTKKNGKSEKKAAAEKPKYGVLELAEALEIEPATVRVKLRNEGIKKSGKSYGWDTKAAFDKVIAQLTAEE